MTKILSALTILLAAAQAVSAACRNPTVRKPWTALTNRQKASYINSTLCLMNPEAAPAQSGAFGAQSRWEELLVAHMAQVRFIHTVGALFPWHRWYTKIHEDLLRNECGYDGPYPYWDEQIDQGLFPIENASVWDRPNCTATTFGTGNTDENGCIVDGAYADYRVHYATESGMKRTDEGFCLTRALNQTAFDTVSQDVVDRCMAVDSDDYAQMLTCLGDTPHSGGHLGVGGIMRDHARSPVDPVFWLHHTNFDRLWWNWQSQNLSTRLYAMGGPNVASAQIFIQLQPASLPLESFVPYFDDGGNVTTLDHVMWMPGLAENITIRDAMDIRSELMCFEYL